VGTVVVLCLISLLAPLIAPYDPIETTAPDTLLPPLTSDHPLGSDIFGRDQWSRVLWGGRPLIVTSIASVLLALGAGFPIGLVAGFSGGHAGAALMRLMDVMLSFPLILLAMILVAALGPGLGNLILAIAVSQVPVFARLVQALSAREAAQEYVLAARAAGFSAARIAMLEIAPNVFGPVMVQATAIVAVAAGYAAALSYLGLGIQPPQPDWGYMVKESQEVLPIAPSLAIVPGLLITGFVGACNFVGDELRDILTPDERAA
jgi:peptide/nickel transport system permease protein